MFSSVAETITQKLEESGRIQSDQRELYRYGIRQGFIIILNFATSLIIGLIFGMFLQSILFLIGYMPLRSFAGGYHSKTPERCYVFSILLITAFLSAIRFISFSDSVIIIISAAAYLLIIFLAPVADKNKPLDDAEHRVYKRRTVIIAGVELILLLFLTAVGKSEISECFMMIFICLSVMLVMGKVKEF